MSWCVSKIVFDVMNFISVIAIVLNAGNFIYLCICHMSLNQFFLSNSKTKCLCYWGDRAQRDESVWKVAASFGLKYSELVSSREISSKRKSAVITCGTFQLGHRTQSSLSLKKNNLSFSSLWRFSVKWHFFSTFTFVCPIKSLLMCSSLVKKIGFRNHTISY